MATAAGGGSGEEKTGKLVSEEWRFYVFIGLMLLFLGWLFLVAYIGWVFIPFGFFYLMKAYRTKKGDDSFYCSVCGGAVKHKGAKNCPNCGIDFER